MAKKRALVKTRSFSDENAEYICACVANGESMANIFRKKPEEHIHPFSGEKIVNFPRDIRTHYRWVRDFPKYKEMHKQAQEDRADLYVEKLHDLMQKVETNQLGVSQARFSADTIKWIACKFKPQTFSDDAVRQLGKVNEDKLQVQFNFVLNDEKNENKVKQIEVKQVEANTIVQEDAEEAELLDG